MNGTLLFLLMGILFIGGVVSYVPVFGELSYENMVETVTNDLENFRGNEHLTRPTFGVNHETSEIIVNEGFTFNNQTFTITNNFHTPFEEQSINLGEVNSFEATVFTPKGLRVQEFLFGISEIGEAHLAELGIEVWYGYAGEIEKVMAIQKSNVIDKDSIIVTHEKTKCQSFEVEKKCDSTKVSMVFLEPLRDKVMAIKAIDYKNRYHITYLNEGFDISDASLNPMHTATIPSQVRGEDLLQLTQTAKYSPYWMAKDGRIFERNHIGSFKQINISFERFQDSGDPLTRYHSGFGGVLEYEKDRALKIFNATTLLSPISDSYSIEISIGERITDEMKVKLLEQEQIAQKILEASQVQARYSKHSTG